MTSFIFHGGLLFDPRLDALVEGAEVLIEGGHVKEVSDREIRAADAIRIDLGGRTLMPGLIDPHVHIFITEVKLALLENIPLTLLAVQATHLMRAMLMRGFTTVRDTGGGDWGMKFASDTGLIEGPRLFICGQSISQTGGHGDFRRRTHDMRGCPCCAALSYLSRIVDGVPEMLKAVRDELRKGADHIKLMVSGGVASPHDPPDCVRWNMPGVPECRSASAAICSVRCRWTRAASF